MVKLSLLALISYPHPTPETQARVLLSCCVAQAALNPEHPLALPHSPILLPCLALPSARVTGVRHHAWYSCLKAQEIHSKTTQRPEETILSKQSFKILNVTLNSLTRYSEQLNVLVKLKFQCDILYTL